MDYLQMAQYAADAGPFAADRPPYPSSPNGMAFMCGLWAWSKGLPVLELKASRGYKWILNRDYVLDFKGSFNEPVVSRV